MTWRSDVRLLNNNLKRAQDRARNLAAAARILYELGYSDETLTLQTSSSVNYYGARTCYQDCKDLKEKEK